MLETLRLMLLPCSCDELLLGHRSFARLAQRKGLRLYPGTPDNRRLQKRVFRAKARLIDEHPQTWLLCTAWLIVEKKTQTVMGDLGFKGYWPQENFWDAFPAREMRSGRRTERGIELGYGLYHPFHGQGYMTEAVSALCRFALCQTQHPVCRIEALTRPDNSASHRVLEKNGFRRGGEQDGLFFWEKIKPLSGG